MSPAIVLLISSVAAAGDPVVPDGFERVELATTPLVFEGAGWLRTPVGCRAVEVTDGHLLAEVCQLEGATCTWSTELDDTWSPYGMTMCERPDGTGWGGGGGGSIHGAPQRVTSPRDRVVWRAVVELVASPERLRRDVHPCTPQTAAHEGPDVHDGERWCDQAGGGVVRVVPLQTGLPGVGIGVLTHDEPVDCTVPCDPDPGLQAVRDTNAGLQGRFSPVDAGRVELFRDRAACDASIFTSAVVFDLGACDGPD
jgi:hypothetical protein